jgi:hypothetical protein
VIEPEYPPAGDPAVVADVLRRGDELGLNHFGCRTVLQLPDEEAKTGGVRGTVQEAGEIERDSVAKAFVAVDDRRGHRESGGGGHVATLQLFERQPGKTIASASPGPRGMIEQVHDDNLIIDQRTSNSGVLGAKSH